MKKMHVIGGPKRLVSRPYFDKNLMIVKVAWVIRNGRKYWMGIEFGKSGEKMMVLLAHMEKEGTLKVAEFTYDPSSIPIHEACKKGRNAIPTFEWSDWGYDTVAATDNAFRNWAHDWVDVHGKKLLTRMQLKTRLRLLGFKPAIVDAMFP